MVADNTYFTPDFAIRHNFVSNPSMRGSSRPLTELFYRKQTKRGKKSSNVNSYSDWINKNSLKKTEKPTYNQITTHKSLQITGKLHLVVMSREQVGES